MRHFTAAVIILSGIVGRAAIIADFTTEFNPVTPNPGWQYMRNTGPIGTSANYVPLLWDVSRNIYTANGVTLPAPGPDWTLVGPGFAHPGRGSAQAGTTFSGYAIAAYTVQPGEGGMVDVVNGSISGADPSGAGGASNGWDIMFFVNDVPFGAVLFPWSSTTSAFSASLGLVQPGDRVYVALGPNTIDLFDSARFSFQLNSTPTAIPEPGTIGLTIAGLAVAALRIHRAHGS